MRRGGSSWPLAARGEGGVIERGGPAGGLERLSVPRPTAGVGEGEVRPTTPSGKAHVKT